MKKIIACLTIVISLATLQSCNGDKKEKASDEIPGNMVPASVQSAFSAKYSTATDVKWEDAHEDDIKTYKAKFMLDGKKMKAEFDANGALIKAEED
jgi:hypothetical protein